MLVFVPAVILLPAGDLFSTFFLFAAPASTEIYTLSLHDALPILWPAHAPMPGPEYVYAVVFTAADHGVVEQVKCINDKVEPVHFVDENLRPKRKSTFVRLGRLKGLRANQETRPPVGPAKVLTSARVI